MPICAQIHGLRGYRRGCRCVRCRASNAGYHADCRQSPRHAVDATRVRDHLAALAGHGLGTRQIAQLAGLSRATVVKVLRGVATVRPSIAAALLAVRPQLARGTVIAGTVAWRSIDSLEREGYTRRTLARLMGFRSHQLQLHRHLTVTSALKIAALYDRLTRDDLPQESPGFAEGDRSAPVEISQPGAS